MREGEKTTRSTPVSAVIAWLLTALVAAAPLRAAAQSPPPRYDVARLDGAHFTETIHSDVTTQSGSAERRRTIDRVASYSIQLAGDTVVVTADSIAMRENDQGVVRDIDVDAVIGGRWKLLLDSTGRATVVVAPFVPGEIAEVSDLATAMDDFFPETGVRHQGSPRKWQALPDSAGASRRRWSWRGPIDPTADASDSTTPHATGTVRDEGQLAWERSRGPIAWTRDVSTDFSSVVGGRVVRGTVHQHITVMRRQ